MKKMLLIGALALANSGAFAQSSQGQAGATTASDHNPAANASKSAKSSTVREGATTGAGTGKNDSPNGAPNARPKTTTGPQAGSASDAESPPK